MIQKAARAAVLKRGQFKPYIVNTPVEIKIEYTNTHFADNAGLNPYAERCGGRTVRFVGDDFIAVLNSIR
jgi:D-aminopeptidase